MNIGLYQSASSMSALERWQDATSQNITSAQTTGYRKRTVEFSSQVAGKWNIRPDAKNAGPENEHAVLFTKVTTGINFMTGETQPTRRELDVAIQGDGFFEMDGPGGQKLYTRSGEFRMTPERTLVGAGGLPVLTEGGNQITMLPGGGAITINRDGTIFQGSTALGKLGIYKFSNPAALMPTAGGMFVAGPEAGKDNMSDPELMQGYLEQSNVQPLREMVDLVLISRAYEANQKIITSADEQMEKTLQALG
ncbi:MAG: flagellar hook-basal body protein [Candidatus Didemnitutus sp.]|nr:flagellar hook-basal body protein [Candidatus Didemnitutus sp.]